MDFASLKAIAGMIATVLVGYTALTVGLAVYLMQRAHMPFAAARHYSMLFLFRIPFYLGLLAAVWALIYQLYQR